MNITVYLASNMGNNPEIIKAAGELGKEIAKRSHTLVFGGSRSGLMGVLSDSALAAGGKVTGVTPKDIEFIRKKIHPGLTKVIETENMAERKTVMMNLGDAFIALPGGMGTLDEMTEILVINYLKNQNKPIVFLNADGFYDSFRQVIETMEKNDFSHEGAFSTLHFASTVAEALDYIENFGK